MRIKRGKIILENLQVKSIEKAKRLASALSIIEEECGIHEVEISIQGFFVCPWIDLDQLNCNGMERLLSGLFKKATKKQ
jgi:hypothetical protein